jgi:4-hydroxybenzoyl-CoA reductase subunit alpha
MAARDLHGPNPPWAKGFSVVGQPQRKVDGLSKATGEAVYTDDIALPGMLHAKTLRSPLPHARIKRIDVSRALALPGVHAVITGRDLPERYGVIPWTQDETALAVDKVRFVGDPVAAVAALDEDTAVRALELIVVEYEPLHAFLEPEDALRQAEPKIHEDKKNNVSKHVLLDFGDVDAAIAGADVTVEGDFGFHSTTHAPIEPHCAVARVSPDGVLTVWSATQITHYVHRALAKVLGLPEQQIRVIQPCLGGAFGGKSDPFSLEFCVAKLALLTGRPVKMLYTREEVFYTHRGRHAMKLRYRTGAKKDGRLTGVDAKILIDGGAYSSFGLVTTYYSGQLLTGPYDFPTYRFDSTRVFTNKPPCGPKRGHGSVQPRFAFEVQLDEVADALGLDPIAIRRKNFQGTHTQTVNGQRITSNGFLECLAAVEAASGWKERRAKLPYGRGLGVAGSHVHLGYQLSGVPERDAAGRRAAQGRPLGARHGLHRRQRHRPGLELGGAQHRGRGAGAAPRARARGRRGHRPVSGRSRRVLEPRDLHGRQRDHRRLPQAAGEDRRERGGQVGGGAGAHRHGPGRGGRSGRRHPHR